jgi:hypothetical protein
MVRAVINNTGGVTAKISPKTGGLPQQVSVTLPSGATLQNSALKLALLQDVVTTNISDGALLQYRESDQKFVARTELETETGTLIFNGGNF